MRAPELVDRHLPVVELRTLQILTQVAHHELLTERLLVGKSRSVDRLEYLELLFGVLVLLRDRRGRVIAQAVVVAVVADVGGEFRIGAELVLPFRLQRIA